MIDKNKSHKMMSQSPAATEYLPMLLHTDNAESLYGMPCIQDILAYPQTRNEDMCQNICDTSCSYPNTFFDDLFRGQENTSEQVNVDLIDTSTSYSNQRFDNMGINNVLDCIDLVSGIDRNIDLCNVFTHAEEINTGPTLAKLNELKEEEALTPLLTTEKCFTNCLTTTSANVSRIDYSPLPSNATSFIGATDIRPMQQLKALHGNHIQSLMGMKKGTDSNEDSATKYGQESDRSTSSTLLTEDGTKYKERSVLNSNVGSSADFEEIKVKQEKEINITGDLVTEKPVCDLLKEENQSIETVDNSSDSCDDTASDCGSCSTQDLHSLPEHRSSRKNKCFWEYNVNAKKKLKSSHVVGNIEDPHVLPKYVDPVFNAHYKQTTGIGHDGKARRGDGNDLTPNPAKLFRIGQQLQKLNSDISSIHVTPVNELPTRSKDLTRKQKNKLASRACRLKKKGQHEANKIKLYGLDHEHEGLMRVINAVKSQIIKAVDTGQSESALSVLLSKEMAANLGEMVAGNTPQYVNAALWKMEMGDKQGGLNLSSPEKKN